MRTVRLRVYGIFGLAFAILGGCAGIEAAPSMGSVPNPSAERMVLVREAQKFGETIGFAPTNNFKTYAAARSGYAWCGYVPRLYVPYSGTDPAIRWKGASSATECRPEEGYDVVYRTAEAVAGIGTPVTAWMMSASLPRLMYLVFHEDCHEQFSLPLGIEEAACNVIGVEAGAAFGKEKYGPKSAEYKALAASVRSTANHARIVNAHYAQLERLQERYVQREVTEAVFLKERAAIFRAAERALRWKPGDLNNVSIADELTYSRYHELAELVFEATGRDIGRTIAFFKKAAAELPDTEEVLEACSCEESSVEFVRAYEAAVAAVIEAKAASLRKKQ